jgi:TRAP-type mannitol/chloroaromatic compound transport system permease large subunit
LSGGATGFLIVVAVLIFVLGLFLDFFEIAFVLFRCWHRSRSS